MKHLLRGLFDTDGSLILWKTNNRLYPRIYFSNTSKELVKQIKDFLIKEKFKVTYWETKSKKEKWNHVYKITLNGDSMLLKWIKEIGFSNPKNIKKYKKIGF